MRGYADTRAGDRHALRYAVGSAILALLAGCSTSPAPVPPTGTATVPAPAAFADATATGSSAPATTTATASPRSTRSSPAGIPTATAAPSRPAGIPLDPAAIRVDPIPYPQARRDQMAAYAKRHYGIASATLTPRVIVLHFTETDAYAPVWSTFAANTANRGELPGTCAHYVVEQNGLIHQLVPDTLMCRHAIGLNHVALGIEVVQATHGHSSTWADRQILARPAQREALLALVRQLQARHGIAAEDVIGHAMADDHRLFLDLLGWRNDHTDWQSADLAMLRALL